MKTLLILAFIGFNVAPSAAALSVKIHQTNRFTQSDLNKLNLAVQMIGKVMNGVDFKNAVLNFSYQGAPGFVQNNGMSNQQIYDFLMNGAETLPEQTSADQAMDLSLDIYKTKWYQRHNVLGYTSVTDPVIHMARWFYDEASVSDIAMNLSHEWCHKMGFDHDFNPTDRRPFSVPYAIGYLVRDLGNELK